MTDDDKALVERLWNRVEYRWDGQTQIREIDTDATYAAHRIEELSAENERLREALREVFEEWAGSEGFIPETAPEGYLLQLTKRMADIARAALGETK